MRVFRFQNFLVALAVTLITAAASAGEVLVYIGTYTNALSRGIYVSRLNTDTGELSAPELAVETPSPCYLAAAPGGQFLYAANSVRSFSDNSVKNGGAVSAFAIDKTSGKLTPLNQKCSGGVGPCHVSVDAAGRVLFVANYGDGSVKTFPLTTNGVIGDGGTRAFREGHGVNPNRQTSAHAHFISPDPSNRFALECDLGLDEVISYPFDHQTADLHVSAFEVGGVPPGAGARHLVFSADGKTIYVLNEMGCSISRFLLDGKGRLLPQETISALPPGVSLFDSFTAAEILIHPSGKFVYTSIRGHDSISVFAVDAQTGRLTFIQNASSGGSFPRGLGIDPTGRWLFAGNQKSDNAVEFAVDPVTGRFSTTGRELKIGSPVDVKFVR